MKKMKFLLLPCLIISLLSSGCAVGVYTGFAYERNANGSLGPQIPGVEVVFTSEDNSKVSTIVTDSIGQYKIALPAQRYYVEATHPDFEPYSTAPGFFVVQAGKTLTGNIILEQ